MTESSLLLPGSDTDRAAAAVRAALTEVLERDITEVADSASLFDELGLDSTSVLDLLMILEESMGIEVDTNRLAMSDFASIQSLIAFAAQAPLQ